MEIVIMNGIYKHFHLEFFNRNFTNRGKLKKIHCIKPVCDITRTYTGMRGKAMANYPQELAQDAVCQSHTGHMTGFWFLPSPAFKAEY